jgi:uncharacterized membrane protein (UPF0127 family)
VRAVNVTRHQVLADRMDWAGSSAARRKGLLGRDTFERGEGIYLAPCQWVHMFGMKFAIDVAFLAKDGRVLALHHALKPGTISKLVWRADGVLELPVGVLQATGTVVGDVVDLRENEAS